VLLGLGVYIRAKVSETPVFTEAREKRKPLKLPALEAIRRSPRNFFVVVGARLAENALGYLYPVFGLSYVITNLGMSREVAITVIRTVFAVANSAIALSMLDAPGHAF